MLRSNVPRKPFRRISSRRLDARAAPASGTIASWVKGRRSTRIPGSAKREPGLPWSLYPHAGRKTTRRRKIPWTARRQGPGNLIPRAGSRGGRSSFPGCAPKGERRQPIRLQDDAHEFLGDVHHLPYRLSLRVFPHAGVGHDHRTDLLLGRLGIHGDPRPKLSVDLHDHEALLRPGHFLVEPRPGMGRYQSFLPDPLPELLAHMGRAEGEA